MDNTQRCSWCTSDPIYQAYHDLEWGMPLRDGLKLFALLQLEGMQAGLRWITVLKRREALNQAFCDFNPLRLLEMDQKKRDELASNAAIIRHRGKISAVFSNAKAYATHFSSAADWSEFLWQSVGGHPILNQWDSASVIPTMTEQSIALSESLKKRGFKFVGPTICYAFMQAAGLVNDHESCCFLGKQRFF